MMIYKSGKLRADKVQYEDGIGCTVWYPFPGDPDEDAGICFDFSAADIADFIALLQMLKEAPAEILEDIDEVE